MRVVRSFSRQRSEAGVFTRNGHMMARQEILAWWSARGIEFTWSVLIPVASAMLLYWGGNRVLSDMEKLRQGLIQQQHALTVGDLVMFMSYLMALLGPIGALAASATALQNSLSGLDRVLDLLAESLEMPATPGAKVVDRLTSQGRITMRKVSFAYAGSDTPVLQDINLEVRPGEMIALVGPSGAGKTTLCNLVARFYDPTAGTVLLDGGESPRHHRRQLSPIAGHRRAGHISVRWQHRPEHRLRPPRRQPGRNYSEPHIWPTPMNSSSS